MLIRANCYKLLFRPIVEYAAAVWSPHLQYQIHQLERKFNAVQHALL